MGNKMGLIARKHCWLKGIIAEPHNPCTAQCASAGGREGGRSGRICPEDLPVSLLVRQARREKEQAYQYIHL